MAAPADAAAGGGHAAAHAADDFMATMGLLWEAPVVASSAFTAARISTCNDAVGADAAHAVPVLKPQGPEEQ
eukprot:gene21401-25730_t